MLKILRDRLIRLGCDEDGVALVVTLGVFMFLYVVCASVYAVGWTVKEKLHLQGACDAAAYSAAIVQADTFSRIATINRAMSWTYQQMTRRQMDYIVWQWLEEAVEHYKHDKGCAEDYAREQNRRLSGHLCELGIWRQSPWGQGWDISAITLNNHGPEKSMEELEALCDDGHFGAWIRNRDNRSSFYSRNPSLGPAKRSGLGLQIDDDLRNIRDMSFAVDQLARSLRRNVNNAVSGIIKANLPGYALNGDCRYFIEQDSNPRTSYFETIPNTEYGELIFLSLGDSIVKSPREAFDKGIDVWFERGGSSARDLSTSGSSQTGIHRLYDPARTESPLLATWTWWARAWRCVRDPVFHSHTHVLAGSARTCGHGHDKCRCRSGGAKVNASCWANNSVRYDNRFSGQIDGQIVWAKPLRLRKDYFGPAGTITVGLARRNENPWFSLFGRVTGGLYSAFSPVSNSWSYCFASAKAGYKLYHVPKDYYIDAHRGEEDSTIRRDDWEERYNGTVRVYNGPRDYCVDWKDDTERFMDWIRPYERDEFGNIVRNPDGSKKKSNTVITYWTNPTELRPSWRQSWNLIQDDWDAVMIPVRQGCSMGYEEEAYSLREWWRRRTQDYSRDNWGAIPYRYEPVWRGRNRNYLAKLVNSANWQALSGKDAPNTVVTGTSEWNIENPGARLDWNRIGDEMYH